MYNIYEYVCFATTEQTPYAFLIKYHPILENACALIV
jgi:hypothetical protein